MRQSDAWSDESYENEEVTESDVNTIFVLWSVSFLCMPILDRIEQISTYYVVHIMYEYDNVIKYNVRRLINF